MTIQFETFEVGPFTFTAQERWGHLDDNTQDRIELAIAWNDWPTIIGSYPTFITLDRLKEEGAKWLLAKLTEWEAETQTLFTAEARQRRASALLPAATFMAPKDLELAFTPKGVCYNCVNGWHTACGYLLGDSTSACNCRDHEHKQWWFRNDGITSEAEALAKDFPTVVQ